MRNLLITAIKESKLGLDSEKKNYEILMITKNLKKSLRKKTRKLGMGRGSEEGGASLP